MVDNDKKDLNNTQNTEKKKIFKNEKEFANEKNALGEYVINIRRVSTTSKGGRRMSFSALVAVGDFKGRYGFAIKKSSEASEAIKKAVKSASKHLYTVSIDHKNFSIKSEIRVSYNATTVMMRPARLGTGLIAGGPVRSILELAGFKNITSKIFGSGNKENVVMATHLALQEVQKREEKKRWLKSETL